MGETFSTSPLRLAFLKCQCRVRQLSMRDNAGRPDDAITPDLYLAGEDDALGAVITILNKSPGYSVTPEMQHMAAKTNDPAQRRETALTFFSATYYQKASEFSDILTATFPPESPGAAQIREAGESAAMLTGRSIGGVDVQHLRQERQLFGECSPRLLGCCAEGVAGTAHDLE